jgi:carbamoyltransferase
MGLAPYGEYRRDFAEKFDQLIEYGGGNYDVTSLFEHDDPIGTLESLFGDRREYSDELTQRHKDFAYHLQLKTEEIVTHLVEHYVDQTGITKVGLSGGVAMNCKLNREVMNLECVDELFIQPAANDVGVSLGAALSGYKAATDEDPVERFDNVYFGSEYSNDHIEEVLRGGKLDFEQVEDAPKRAATLLADDHLVGWFQGRMEFGARALGNRSILANPRSQDSLDQVNKNVKHREAWRPFAPSLLYEAREEYLVNGDESPYMILLDDVDEDKHNEIPAVVHVDGTTRPQTVRKEQNERYYELISHFEELTGTPVVLNTSFNVSGEPIVESPKQALSDFYLTGLDALLIGDYLVQK